MINAVCRLNCVQQMWLGRMVRCELWMLTSDCEMVLLTVHHEAVDCGLDCGAWTVSCKLRTMEIKLRTGKCGLLC